MVANKISHAVHRMKPGTAFPVNAFRIDGNRNTIEQALSRLAKKGEVRRLRRGIYYKPAKSVYFGETLPSPAEVAQAIARLNGARLMPDGPMALYQLGWTTQIPMKYVYLNDKLHKTEWVGNTPIVFKRISHKKLLYAGKKAGLVLSALSYLGKTEAKNPDIWKKITHLLNEKERQELRRGARHYPSWLQDLVEKRLDGHY